MDAQSLDDQVPRANGTQISPGVMEYDVAPKSNPAPSPAQVDSAPATDGEAAQPVATSPAVQDITHRPHNWWSDLLDKSSPIHFALDISETYDDNIFISPQKVSDYITNISPEVSAEFGNKTSPNSNYLSATAQYSFLLYAQNSDQDANDYFLDLHYQHQFTKLTLGLEQQVRRETTTNIDVGSRVQSDVYATVATATYDYNDQLSLRGTATQNVTVYDNPGYIDTTERVADFYALYQVLPKLGLGLGPRFGAVDVQPGPNQTYEDGLFDLIYEITGKTKVTLVTGPEIRQYQGSSAQTVTPVIDLNVEYLPTDDTVLKFDAHRRRVVSFGTEDEDYINNEVEVGVRQFVLQKAYLNLAAGYDLNQYSGNGGGTSDSEREDNYFYVRTGVEWKANDWLDVEASYQYSKDDSNEGAFSFNDNQVTLKARLSY